MGGKKRQRREKEGGERKREGNTNWIGLFLPVCVGLSAGEGNQNREVRRVP